MGQRVDVEEGAAFEGAVSGAGAEVALLEGVEHAGLEDFGEIDEGGVVEEPGGFGGVAEIVVGAAGTGVAAVFFEDEGVDGVVWAAGFVEGAGEELSEKEFAVGGPGKALDGVG